MLIIRGVNVFPTQIEELILSVPALAPHYVLEVTREGPLDALTIHVESGSDAAACESAALALKTLVKSYIGLNATVRVGAAGAVERSLGKAKRIIDKRNA
jgi:phenylacetate-CoA ligase